MIDVEGIREALEPYREDLIARRLSDGESVCAAGALYCAVRGWSPRELAAAVVALRSTGPSGTSAMAGRHFDILTEAEIEEGTSTGLVPVGSALGRIIEANNMAPDGFARYQAVMAEVARIAAEQRETPSATTPPESLRETGSAA